jgi:hypothetical protein
MKPRNLCVWSAIVGEEKNKSNEEAEEKAQAIVVFSKYKFWSTT